jgi:hypothetical protein
MTDKTIKQIAFTLFATTFFLACLIQDTGFGSIDAARRFEATEAIWKNQPAASAQDIADRQVIFGVNGSAHYQYGMGQSIYMLPADIVSSLYLRSVGLPENSLLHTLLVTLITFPLFSAATVTISFLLLLELGFSRLAALGGALSLFFGTTLLHYTQVHQENSQITFFTLCGYYQILLWLKRRKLIHLFVGSSVLSAMLLMRVTTVADIACVALFGVLVLFIAFYRTQRAEFWRKFLWLVGVFGSTSGFFYFLDRAYQFKRFGSWTNNYVDVLRDQILSGSYNVGAMGLVRDQIPPNWPFDANRFDVIPKLFFSPEKAIFLYDPLLVFLIGIVLVLRFRVDLPETFPYRTAYLISGVILLILYVGLYSNVSFWTGDWAWALRYFTSPIHVLCLVAVPLFIEALPRLQKFWKLGFGLLLTITLVIQVASISLYMDVEFTQEVCNGASTFRLGQRFANLAMLLSGRSLEFNRQCPDMQNAPANPNFIPFLPFSVGGAQPVFIIVWLALVGLCLFFIGRLVWGLARAHSKTGS